MIANKAALIAAIVTTVIALIINGVPQTGLDWFLEVFGK